MMKTKKGEVTFYETLRQANRYFFEEKLEAKGVTPGLGTILVGDDPASASYVRGKERACHELVVAPTTLPSCRIGALPWSISGAPASMVKVQSIH